MTASVAGAPAEFQDRRPFALLSRPSTTPAGQLELLRGPVSVLSGLDALPAPGADSGPVLVLLPYRAAAERGMECHDDGAPILAMDVTEQSTIPESALGRYGPEVPLRLRDGGFDIADDRYEDIVRTVLNREIGTGEGCNFVISRTFTGTLESYTLDSALALFRRLVERERGAYWTFLVHTGDRTFVGASPERHITLDDGTAAMNPISGTYRYPPEGPTPESVLEFLGDGKETDELTMVLDEELKVMGGICDRGARAVGPLLKEMGHLAHTEYFIVGRTSLDPAEILRRSLFAPTVVGSPLANAFRVVRRYERTGRGYYSGVIALLGRDGRGRPSLDSAILIRTAEISAAGSVRIGVGATLVRHSDPAAEVAETRAKAQGLLSAMGHTPRRPRPATEPLLGRHPEIRAALESRNTGLGRFWFTDEEARTALRPALAGRSVLVIDAEDSFTTMLGHQLASVGLEVTLRSYADELSPEDFDLVVLGPGPGDPLAARDPRIGRLREIGARLLAGRTPFLAVCLGHQVLSSLLGLRVVRRARPNQGVQRRIDLFGGAERVGFYNTFVALSDADRFEHPHSPAKIDVSRDAGTCEVHALRGPGFCSLQFHAESVLTEHGPHLIGDLLTSLLGDAGSRQLTQRSE
ncbi:anthranilate synthase family protein [Streptomyces sp. NPDC059398]|uniref:anthranilate synthase family protein n=1 Tax=Streptomyces sp. NPDC059398 TaxID=3346820 RepID=UPI0036A008F2